MTTKPSIGIRIIGWTETATGILLLLYGIIFCFVEHPTYLMLLFPAGMLLAAGVPLLKLDKSGIRINLILSIFVLFLWIITASNLLRYDASSLFSSAKTALETILYYIILSFIIPISLIVFFIRPSVRAQFTLAAKERESAIKKDSKSVALKYLKGIIGGLALVVVAFFLLWIIFASGFQPSRSRLKRQYESCFITPFSQIKGFHGGGFSWQGGYVYFKFQSNSEVILKDREEYTSVDCDEMRLDFLRLFPNNKESLEDAQNCQCVSREEKGTSYPGQRTTTMFLSDTKRNIYYFKETWN